MIKTAFLLVIIFIFGCPLNAEQELGVKLDSLRQRKEFIDQAIKKIQIEVYRKLKSSPYRYSIKEPKNISEELKFQKDYGFEINPFGILMEKADAISGAFSCFFREAGIELAFPFVYYNKHESDKLDITSIEAHIRFFFGDKFGGSYFNAQVKYVMLTDIEPCKCPICVLQGRKEKDVSRLGFGVGLGYRAFTKYNFYWGFGISVGIYTDKFDYKTDHDYNIPLLSYVENGYVDFELLKIGYAF